MKTIIINPIRTDFIKRNVDTLWKHNDMETTRVVVIDQTKKGVYEEIGDKVHMYLRPQHNLGFAKSMNEGIIHAISWKSDYIVCSNDDVEYMHDSWWDGIMDTFKKDERIMVANPSSPGDRNAEPRIPYKQDYTEEEYKDLIGERMIDGICMWCPVFPRDVLLKLGPFDERFYPGGGEDYDMNGRIYKAGGRAVGTDLAWLWHWWGKSKDEPEEAALQRLDNYKDPWNSLNDLWNNNFGLYGEGDERVPLIHIDHI